MTAHSTVNSICVKGISLVRFRLGRGATEERCRRRGGWERRSRQGLHSYGRDALRRWTSRQQYSVPTACGRVDVWTVTNNLVMQRGRGYWAASLPGSPAKRLGTQAPKTRLHPRPRGATQIPVIDSQIFAICTYPNTVIRAFMRR
jgi:hypothetical protein